MDAFDQRKMQLMRVVHEETHLLNNIGQVRTSQGKVLESTSNTHVLGGSATGAQSEAESLA